jgi:protein-S-isoprenylcysteine O-methyltransferase Ste14
VIRSAVSRASVLALTLAVSACALTFDSTHLGVPVSLAGAAQAADSGTPFRVTKHPVYLVAGLLPVAQPNLEDVLAGQLGTGARISNLRIKVRSRWSDLLITGITFGLIVPRSVTFEGVVVSK